VIEDRLCAEYPVPLLAKFDPRSNRTVSCMNLHVDSGRIHYQTTV